MHTCLHLTFHCSVLPLLHSLLSPLPFSPQGEGRVHTCLRQNKEKISDRCRKEEMKLQQLEYRDIRLR